MTTPISAYSSIVANNLKHFEEFFSKQQLEHFAQYLTGLIVSENRTVQDINDSFIFHYEDLMAVYKDKGNDLELRASSLASLGSLDVHRAMPVLEEVLKNSKLEIRLRSAAAVGLGVIKNNQAVIDLLAKQYFLTDNEDLRREIILALRDLEAPKAIEPLRKIKSMESDSGLIETIESVLEDLEELE